MPNELEMRLRPMDEAPRDGTKIIVKERNQDGNWYRLCWWKKPYSTNSNCGAWQHLCDGDAVSQITEQRALGWMPEPRSA
ncbi:hypothetical protein ACUN9Y_09535 [Halomonas sp. V046]|uniref:hypothetical protein n=1 Tax=Halomonas sp. V046 TaxID=3459611 RepID=UPI00404478C0